MTQYKGFFRKAADALVEAANRRARRRVDNFRATHMPDESRKVN